MFCWGNEKQNSFNRIRKGQHFVYFICRFTKAFVILPPTNQLQLVLHEGYHATIILQFDCSVIGYFILYYLCTGNLIKLKPIRVGLQHQSALVLDEC